MSEPVNNGGKPAPAPGGKRQQEERRKFLRAAVVGTGVVGFSLAGFLPVLEDDHGRRLRPPGALDEKDFLAACIKCGQCVQVCPVEAIHPADLWDGFGVGVPFIDPRKQACDFACDVGQCILACPTGALEYRKPAFLAVRPGAQLPAPPVLLAKENDPNPTLQFKERMGVARLDRPDACLSVLGKGVKGPARGESFRGLKRYTDVDRWNPVRVREHPYDLERCDLCVRECPIKGAISIQADDTGRLTPTVHAECVGCGVCQMMCPVEPAAIVVDARGTWGGA
ncbi:MAG: 4Fe-4S dicluster domain-containing protein [Deltaproteobacteria bacterium]|nr:4Fe-4S dicluster domain-containing protein [Deltaproteobacteria bacterium]